MSDSSPKYTVLELIQLMTDFLEKKGIENPRLNAELLAGKIFRLDRVQLYLNFEKPVSEIELAQLRNLLKRRGNYEPLQYLIGETEFYSLPFKVTPKTLIPRPETEILVDFIIENYSTFFPDIKEIKILDIGTGSGNIAVALAKNIPNSQITAIDIDEQTIAIAEENSTKNDVRDKIQFIKQDIFSELPKNFDKYQIIVGNLPYISAAEMKTLPHEVKDFEPHTALFGGEDGLDAFRRLQEITDQILSPGGLLALEIGASQGEAVKQIFAKLGRFSHTEIIRDLNGLPRVFWAR
ncbi:protein-(glutamine-N5) methyltransferase, release factor-specific [candidate division KSB1 bacterium 4484_87]|nr:MAG: protein-(glutamine-N5) methyltransferase, release factor-specific [candidate division KSB1 bacterium 4484_87]